MRSFLLVLLGCAALVPLHGRAESRPLWELGLGATAFRLPDYRGSDESRSYVYPLPYFVYRGDKLRVDRQGARAVLLESQRFELDFSAYATPPVDSSKNRARQGMEDLDPTLEVGPQLNFMLARDPAKDWRLDLRLPLRAVIATDFKHVQRAGYVLYPHLNLNLRPEVLAGRWNLGLQAGPLFGTREYHRYFYGVDPQFATAERPAYEARGGYSGAAALATLSRRIGRLWMGGFVRYDSLHGATFENSPLVKQSYSVMAGFAFAWVFAESDRKVDVSE
jgi:outer membrane scaffolding protein for murein synthesis (MipA/OmpV family)